MATKTKPELRVDVIPSGVQSAYVEAPFNEGKETLEKAGYELISGEINTGLRIQQGREAYVSQDGNFINEGVLYVPERFGKKAGAWIPKKSLVMQFPTEATNAHRNGKEFYVSEDQTEEALKDAVKAHGKEVPTKRLADDEAMARVFGANTKDYGLFLNEAGIDSIRFYLSALEDKPFANQLWLDRLGDGDGSGLIGCNWDLYCDSRVRGVSNTTGEASSHATGDSYTLNDFKKALKAEGIGGDLEKRISERLRK